MQNIWKILLSSLKILKEISKHHMLIFGVLVAVLFAMIKISRKKIMRGSLYFDWHFKGVHSVITVKSGQQEAEAAVHIMSADKKQRDMSIGVLLSLSLPFSGPLE